MNVQQWFRDISISKKLIFTIGIMALLIIVELFTLWFSLHLLSGVRAAVQQEGYWSKAQKDAINTLQQYAYSSDTAEYTQFQSFLEVNDWDRKAIFELNKPDPDYDVMLDAFVKSGVHPEDGNAITNLFYYFNEISYVEQCINIFLNANDLMTDLQALGARMHNLISANGSLSSRQTAVLFEELNNLNAQLTVLEVKFSNTLGEAARWLDNLVLKILFGIALTVETTGILLAISLSRSISKGINEVIRVSKSVSKGDFEKKAAVYSKDEIGVLATSFNEMIDEVRTINMELEQFAYIASHDLQEPLLTISNYNKLLQDPNTKLKQEEKHLLTEFIGEATLRMQNLIKDLMDFSLIGKNTMIIKVDMQALLEEIVEQLQFTIAQKRAEIKFKNLPVVKGGKSELIQIFQNLISNAIKFQKQDTIPVVTIQYIDDSNVHKFVVKDNGIGIPKEYQERIFAVFQRLHNPDVYQGTGIGLAICVKVAKVHNGKLEVFSQKGEGSEFHFSFPKNLG